MNAYWLSSRWAFPITFTCLALATACSSDPVSSPSAAGAPSGGSANTGSGGSSAGAATTAGGASGGSTQGGAGGTTAQAGAATGGSGGAAGTSAGGTSAGGTSAGGASAGGTSSGGASSGGSGGASTGGFTLTTPGWTGVAACAADMKTVCPVFPKENIGTNIGGTNKSPELNWSAGPTGTQSYAIVLQDLTNIVAMTGKPFVHWVMWNIPAATHMLPAGLETTQMPAVPAGSSQRNYNATGANQGYQGSGKCGNVYEFVLYALPTASYAGTSTSQTAVRDGLVTTGAPTATLRARSGAPGCTE